MIEKKLKKGKKKGDFFFFIKYSWLRQVINYYIFWDTEKMGYMKIEDTEITLISATQFKKIFNYPTTYSKDGEISN